MAGYPADHYVTPEPHMELTADRKMLRISQPLPGVKKSDLNVEVHETGFCMDFTPEGKKPVHRCHNLAYKIDPDTAKAKFESGVLTITVDRKELGKGKRLTLE